MNAFTPTQYARLPDEMRAARRWMLWKRIPGGEGKKDRKVPYYANGATRSGKLDTPEDWANLVTLDEAISALVGGGYAGLGFALGPDGSGKAWQGVDLDGIRERPELHDLARRLPGFVEASPSGNGLHAIGYGRSFRALGSNASGIEAYSSGRYFTVTGRRLSSGELVDLADFVEDEIRALHSPTAVVAPPVPERSAAPLPSVIVTPKLLAELRDALTYIEAHDDPTWSRMGYALKTLGEAGWELWHEWSATSEKYDPEQADAMWQRLDPERTDHRAVFAEAKRRGWSNPARRARTAPSAERQSEEDLALTFARENEAGLRFCAVWGQWLAWDGTRWEPDKTLLATDLVRDLCRRAAAEAPSEGSALVLGAARTSQAVERLARADRRLAATSDQWDADPWLLNTPGAVVDLKTGELRPPNPALHMTKVTAVAPGPANARPETWLRFLDRITGGDAELQAYLQRVLGYALTGDTSAHALFFGYGTGANGKSVLIDTIGGILGDYHTTAPIETFTESRGERHPTELARLRGARLVTAAETEEGRAWAESRIKTLTGGDRVAARFMRQDFFEFDPQFKLFIAGNHRPGLRSVDEAMRRRFHLVPFAVTIPVEERDEGLKDKLRAEWPMILTWMIEGCRKWQRDGLAPPSAVKAATDAYLEGEDALAAWIEEACERNPQAWERTRDLYSAWKSWAERHGERVGAAKQFSQSLEARGFVLRRTDQARGVAGLRLKPLDPSF